MTCYDVDHDLGVGWNRAWKISTSVLRADTIDCTHSSQDDEDTYSPSFVIFGQGQQDGGKAKCSTVPTTSSILFVDSFHHYYFVWQ